MESCRNLTSLILSLLLLGLASFCVKAHAKPSENHYYVTQEVIYLRDGPTYAGNVVGALYLGDEVERIDASKSNWWLVRHLGTGQEGWSQKELFSPDPVPSVYYYVNANSVALRECPGKNCPSLQMLFRGNKVKKVGENNQGWWRVLVPDSRSLGWVPASSLVERFEGSKLRQPSKSYYYVAVRKLNLRAEPELQSQVIRSLRFNDQVEKIDQNSQGWFKVRQPSSGAVGWVSGNFLETLPLLSPRGGAPPGTETGTEISPFKPREEQPLEPEIM